MNKTFSRILLCAAVLVALLVLAVLLALVPSVQKWALMRAVGGTPGISVKVDSISAGFSSAAIKNLHLEREGAIIEVPSASAEYSALGYLTAGEIRVSSVNAKGVVVDLRKYAPESEAASSKPAGVQDLLNVLLLPAGLRLDAADLDAEIILPSPGSADGRRVRVTLQGGGVAPGSDAAFDLSAHYTDPSKEASVTAATAKGRLSFTAGTDGAIQ